MTIEVPQEFKTIFDRLCKNMMLQQERCFASWLRNVMKKMACGRIAKTKIQINSVDLP